MGGEMRDDCFPQLNGDWDGPIRMLQEFVQAVQEGSHSEEPILMWNGATREVHGRAEFQSTVAFVLDGVPHHVDGEWLESARVSQLNAAACALGRLRKISHPHLQCGICGGVEGGVGHW